MKTALSKEKQIDYLDSRFNVGDEVIVILKETMFFSPMDGRREITLESKGTLGEREGISFPIKNNRDFAKFAETGFIAIRSFAGYYAGYRRGSDNNPSIKIRPYYGIAHYWSDYFIIYDHQIERISRYNLEDTLE